MTTQVIPEQLLATPAVGLGRIRQCNAQGLVTEADKLDFDPSMGGKDAQWVLSNPVCLGVIIYSYTSVRTAINMMNVACGNPRPTRFAPSLITDIADITRATYNLAHGACSTYLAAATATMSSFMGVLGIIYAVADDAYRTTKICGDGWYGPDTIEHSLYGKAYQNRTIPDYPAAINTTQKIINLCRTSVDKDAFRLTYGPKTCDDELSLNKPHYREFFYGGIEVEDNPINESKCYDPYMRISQTSHTNPTPEHRYHRQKYYMKGFEEANYNCQKYRITNDIDPLLGGSLTPSRLADFKRAHACCINRAANYVCINYKDERRFCKADSQCTISKGAEFVTFQTKSRERKSKICVQTYSLCPYNFYIKGGAAVCDYYKDTGITQVMVDNGTCGTRSEVRNRDCTMNKKAGKCKNYCQHMTHCVKTTNVYVHNFSDASPYFSAACIDFAGDSQNRVSYGSGFFQGSMRHFSAPMVQCFKETLENVFHNRAGHSRCLTNAENAGIDITGVCPSGFSYRKGEAVYQKSFFETFQNILTNAVKVALSLVIVFYGIKVLTGGGEIKKKDLMLLVVKIAVVMYFATGTAWKDTFFDGIYNTSTFLSELVFKIQMPEREDKRDGCQFGNVYTSIQSGSTATTLASSRYPEGKSYLAIWDTLDCKLARYMGFGPENSVANIALLVIAGWLIGPIGSYFVTVIFLFAFLMISVIIRAVHIFLASTMAIILLVFISPITITCILTDKTKDIFNNWLKQIMSYALQPMILFIYLAIMVSLLDKALIGSASYHGSAPAKTINCGKYCAESNGRIAHGVSISDCNTNNRSVINPNADSFECMINSDSFSRFPGLELIGVSIPFLVDLFTENPKKKMLTLVRGLMIIYFLYKFMDEVPNIAAQLLGGAKLPQAGAKVGDMFKGTKNVVRGVQKRGGRAAAGTIKRSAGTATKEARSKKEDRNPTKEGGDDDG